MIEPPRETILWLFEVHGTSSLFFLLFKMSEVDSEARFLFWINRGGWIGSNIVPDGAQRRDMHREGRITLSRGDIQKTGLDKESLYQKLLSFYQKRREHGEELYEIRVFAKRQAIEIVFVGRDTRDSDIISLQDFIFSAVINILANQA